MKSCKNCGNSECIKYKVYADIDKYLIMLGGESLRDDLKALVGSECQVFVSKMEQFGKSNDSTFSEVAKSLLGWHKK